MKWPFRRPRTLRETRRLRLAPGDTLVLLFDQRLSTDHKARIAANLKSHFEDNLILVLDEGTDVAVLDPRGSDDHPRLRLKREHRRHQWLDPQHRGS